MCSLEAGRDDLIRPEYHGDDDYEAYEEDCFYYGAVACGCAEGGAEVVRSVVFHLSYLILDD